MQKKSAWEEKTAAAKKRSRNETAVASDEKTAAPKNRSRNEMAAVSDEKALAAKKRSRKGPRKAVASIGIKRHPWCAHMWAWGSENALTVLCVFEIL